MKMDQTIPESILTLRRIGHTFVFASFEWYVPSEFLYLLTQDKRNCWVISVVDSKSALMSGDGWQEKVWKEMKWYILNWLVVLVLVLKSKNFIFDLKFHY